MGHQLSLNTGNTKLHLLYTFWSEFIFHLLLHVLLLSLVAVEVFADNSICEQCESGVHGQYFINYSLLAFALIFFYQYSSWILLHKVLYNHKTIKVVVI